MLVFGLMLCLWSCGGDLPQVDSASFSICLEFCVFRPTRIKVKNAFLGCFASYIHTIELECFRSNKFGGKITEFLCFGCRLDYNNELNRGVCGLSRM